MSSIMGSSRIYECDCPDTSRFYMWPLFRDPAVRNKYSTFCDGIPPNFLNAILSVMYYGSLFTKFTTSALRLLLVRRENTGDVFLISISVAAFAMGGVAWVASKVAGRVNCLKRRRRLLYRLHHVLLMSGYLSYFLFVGLRNCSTSSINSLRCEPAEGLKFPIGLALISLVAPLMLYLVSRGDLEVASGTLVGAISVQIIVIATNGFGTSDSVTTMILGSLMSSAAIIGMESTRMTAFVGKFHEQQLNEMKLNFLEKERAQLRSVLWNVAHDMKTPMQSFLAGLHVMQENPERVRRLMERTSDFKLKRDVEGVLHETLSAAKEMSASYELMMMQLNRAMDVSSLENELVMEQPHCSAVPIQETIADVLGVISSLQCDKTKVRVSRMPSYLSPYVLTVRSWLADNLLCVVSNAVKYSSPNSTVHIQMSVNSMAEVKALGAQNLRFSRDATTDDSLLVFTVSDSVAGDVDHTQLFSKFTQSDRSSGGAGLGLYALRLRVLRLGGACGSMPRRDGEVGSVFFFAIPYEPVDRQGNKVYPNDLTDDVDQEKSWDMSDVVMRSDATTVNCVTSYPCLLEDILSGEAEPGETVPDGILVVDDAPSTLKLMARVFRTSGANVTTATDGQQALELMKERLFTLVLMDIQMPVMDGIESITLFREWESKEHSRSRTHQFIVAASAVADCREDALKAGADEFHSKPVNVKALLDKSRNSFSQV